LKNYLFIRSFLITNKVMNRIFSRRSKYKTPMQILGSAMGLMLVIQAIAPGAFALNAAYAEQPENPGGDNGSAGEMVNICHRDGGSGNWNALTVNENAVNGHISSHHQDDMDFIVNDEDLGGAEFNDQYCMDNAPTPPPADETGSLTVTKVVVGTSTPASEFDLFVNGMPIVSGVASTSIPVGSYTITEEDDSRFEASFSGDCNASGVVHIEDGEDASCTITNTWLGGTGGVGEDQATLTVTKVVVGGDMEVNDFPLFLNGMAITSGIATTTGVGTFTVTETTDPDYTGAFSGDCNSSGQITLNEGNVKTCTLTNTFTGTSTATTTGTIIVNKVLINDNGGTGATTSFAFMLDNGSSTAFEADGSNSLTVATGTHNIVETAAAGYATTYDGCSNISVSGGDTHTCTITNNDIGTTTGTTTGNIIVNKIVINNNSGTSTASSFPLFVGSTSVVMGATTTLPLGTYTVSETFNPDFYAQSFSGDCNSSGVVTLSATSTVTCTITNHDIPQFCPVTEGMIVSDTSTLVGTSSAALLSFVHPAWTADVDGASTSARWIWSTDPVATTTATTTVTFTRTFTVTGSSTDATLTIATDNTYSVSINGNLVGASTDGNNFTLATQDSYDVSNFLVNGSNTLTIVVTNEATPDITDPAGNPAGLLYNLTWTADNCPVDNGGQGGDNNDGGSVAGASTDNDNDHKSHSRTIVRGINSTIEDEDEDSNGQVLGINTDNLVPLGQVLGINSTLPGLPNTGLGPIVNKAVKSSLLPIFLVGLLALGGLYVLQFRTFKRR
jgi:hypothetical protein